MLTHIINVLRERYLSYRYGKEYIATHVTPTKLRSLGAKIGDNCRIYTQYFSSEPYLIEIGDHVTITDGVALVTHDGAAWVFRDREPSIELFGKIAIGTNVFIGLNAILLPNTSIGDNSIIGAGSLVKGIFAADSVIAGVPAKRIGSTTEYYIKHKPDFSFVRNLSAEEKKMAVIGHINNRPAAEHREREQAPPSTIDVAARYVLSQSQ